MGSRQEMYDGQIVSFFFPFPSLFKKDMRKKYLSWVNSFLENPKNINTNKNIFALDI